MATVAGRRGRMPRGAENGDRVGSDRSADSGVSAISRRSNGSALRVVSGSSRRSSLAKSDAGDSPSHSANVHPLPYKVTYRSSHDGVHVAVRLERGRDPQSASKNRWVSEACVVDHASWPRSVVAWVVFVLQLGWRTRAVRHAVVPRSVGVQCCALTAVSTVSPLVPRHCTSGHPQQLPVPARAWILAAQAVPRGLSEDPHAREAGVVSSGAVRL